MATTKNAKKLSTLEKNTEYKYMKSGLMLGVNPKAERQKEDFYATDPKALELFLDKIDFEIKGIIWECACGKGHLAEVLKKREYIVKSTDLINRGYGRGGVQFLKHNVRAWDTSILTNPPFKLAEQFVEHGIDVIEEGYHLILFLKIQFLEGQKRKQLFKKHPPKYVYCHSSRQLCCKDAEFEKYTATTQFYAWFVWEKGFKGDPIIKWI